MADSVDQILTRLSPGKFDAARAANFDVGLAKGNLVSEFAVERILNLNEEDRTADFAFATDQPIEHYFGNLILSTKKNDVILDRVNEGICPFLVNHNRDDQVGVIVAGSVNLGATIRGKVKFSRGPRGQEIFDDVKDGIRNGTSIGFMVHDMILVSNKKDEIPTYRATKWEMLENSSASIPADIGCGAGRSFERQDPSQISKTTETKMTPEEIAAAEAANETRTVAAPAPAVNPMVAIRREILELGQPGVFDQVELARTYAATDNASVEGFLAAVRAAQKPSTVIPPPNAEDQARAQGGIQLARSIPRYGRLRSFQGQGAEERAYRFGQWFIAARGLASGLSTEGAFARATAFCRENGITITRGQSEGVNESGGFLVPEEFGNDLIDLREQFGVFRRNAKMVPMASDTRSDPRRTGGLTAYFEGESDAITLSQKSWDRVALTAKKLTALGRYSNEIREDAVINIGDDLANEIGYAFANKEDLCGFIGDGSSTYGGMQGVLTKIKGLSGTIANIAGLTVSTGTGYATNYASVVLTDFEAVVGNLPVYADTPNAKWFMHKTFYWTVAKKLELAAGGATAGEIANAGKRTFLGYDIEYVQVMPKTSAVSQVCAILGDLRLAASFGSRRDTTIAISEHSRFANDELEIRGTERFDINVHDVGNASGTASLRVAGPIVGLITAAS